MMWKDIYC